ncbi:MAG: hypothetical protein IPN69_09690 [Acidobacteria bacterium]|nr:hypothetical protein [Acidobacteriota bacterium]
MRFFVVSLGFLVLSTTALAGDDLFFLKATPAASSDPSSIASIRESEIGFRHLSFEGAETIEFTLFDGSRYVARRRGTDLRGVGDFTWRGTLDDGSGGDAVLTVRNGFVSGLIFTRDRVYEIIPRGTKHLLVDLRQDRFPECGGALDGGIARPDGLTPNLATVDSGDRIDVLVVYTTATKNFLGGDAQARTLAQQAVDAANTSYLNSKINLRLRMVHSEEYLYTETTSGSTDLSNLRNNAGIQALRDTHKADLVAMIGEIQGACGVGYLMGSNQASGNPNNGFTVTARSCAVGNLSFAHELGHNMGSAHNPENGSGATYPFGFGHWVNGSYRTVMSYVDPCTSGCTRRPYFSNPAVFFNGFATGIENARDNARSINLTADAIANYRYSGKNIRLLNFTGGETLPRGISRLLTWDSDGISGDVRIELSRDESSSWQVLVPVTPNDGSETVAVRGQVTRRARLRVVSVGDAAISDSSSSNVSIR